MFYDNFTEDQICGLYSPTHIVVIVLFFVLAFVFLFLSRKMSQKTAKSTLLIITITVTILEIIKIVIRICKGESGNSWIPVYFCSLFLYAIWLSFAKNTFLQNIGYSVMTFGGIFASSSFILYPSTSLMTLPVWHPGSIHSIVYHFLMLYAGVLVIMTKLYTPKAKHFLNYFSLLTLACVVAAIINHFCGFNMMFMADPYGLPMLKDILHYSKVLYAILVYLAQSVLLFWFMYGIFRLVEKIKTRRRRDV